MARCISTTRRHGDPQQCSAPAMKGQEVCSVHGGKAPQNKAAAKRRLEEAEAEKLLGRSVWNQNAEPTLDPIAELQALSGRLRDMVETLGARLEVNESCPCCGVSELDSVRVIAFNKTLRESRTILTDMVRIGLESRSLALEEMKVVWVIEALRAGLQAGGVRETDEVAFMAAREGAIAKITELEAAQRRG